MGFVKTYATYRFLLHYAVRYVRPIVMIYEFESEKVKNLMKSKGYSARDVATELGVSEKTVHCWFSGRHKPGWPPIKGLARFLKVKEQELVRFE